MRPFVSALMLASFSLSTLACSPSTKSPPLAPIVVPNLDESTKKVIDQAQKDLEDSQKNRDLITDTLTRGGNAGPVYFYGEIVRADGVLDSRVSFTAQPGTGRDGKIPVPTQALMNATVPPGVAKADRDLGKETTYVNLGCDENVLEGRDFSLRETPISFGPDVKRKDIKAHTVFICDTHLLENSDLWIAAQTIVFHAETDPLKLANNTMLTLQAEEMVLEGDIEINAKAEDSTVSTFTVIPVIIAAEHLSGNGRLKVTVRGANYRAETKKP